MRATVIMGLVRQLLTYESGEAPDSPARVQDPQVILEAAERVCEKLRAHLSRRVGREGFRILLARALALATPQFPHLSAVRVGSDGVLEGLREAAPADRQESGHGKAQARTAAQRESVDGAVALVSSLLALLIVFIGEDLTRRMLHTLWPDLPLDDAASDRADSLSDVPNGGEKAL